MLNFIALELQLYKIFKIMRVSFFGTQCMLYKKFNYNIECEQRTW